MAATQTSSQHESSLPAPKVLFRERLYVPAWWWILLVASIAVFIGQSIIMSTAWWVWVIVAAVVPLVLWLFVRMGRHSLSITEDADGHKTLHAAGANLPFDVIDRCAVVPASAKSAAMGRQLDPEAYVVHRSFIATMVIVVLDDPADPTPYWLVSSRHPEQLTDLLPGKQTG